MHPITVDQNPISTIFFLLTPCHDDLKSCIQTSTELSKICTQLTNTANCTLLFLPEYMVQSFIPVLFSLPLFSVVSWVQKRSNTSSHFRLKNLFNPADNVDGKQKGPIYHLQQDCSLLVLHTRPGIGHGQPAVSGALIMF